jgi:hypothetical protein
MLSREIWLCWPCISRQTSVGGVCTETEYKNDDSQFPLKNKQFSAVQHPYKMACGMSSCCSGLSGLFFRSCKRARRESSSQLLVRANAEDRVAEGCALTANGIISDAVFKPHHQRGIRTLKST